MSKPGNAAQKKVQPTKTPNSDAGLKYEISIATLVAATLSNNEQIENYHVFTNLKEAHPFDDVVVKVIFKDKDDPYAFAMQLKHIGKGETLDVEKYLKGYNKILSTGGFKTIGNIAITNIHFCYFCINKVQNANYYLLHEYTPSSKSWRSALFFSNCHTLLYNKPTNDTDKAFLENFHLYLYQLDNNKIKEEIKIFCKLKNVSGILNYVDRFFEKGELWKAGLSKEVFETELLRIRLSDHIIPPSDIIQLNESQIEIWNKLTLQYNVTLVESEANIEKSLYGCFAKALNLLFNNIIDWSTCKTNNLNSSIINKFKELFKGHQAEWPRHWIDPPTTLKSLIIDLWKCGQLPLILRSDYQLSVLKDYAHLGKSFIIVTENLINKREECDRYHLSVFMNVNDIKCLEMRDTLLETILISLQGRAPITLLSIVQRQEELNRTLSCSHIIHLMKSREAYLSKECLNGDHNMVFLLEDSNSTAEYNIDSINNVVGNIVIRCQPEEIPRYRRQVKEHPNLQNYEIYHCITSSKNENFTLVEGDKSVFKDFFVDQHGEDVYLLENNPIPIVGPSLKNIQQHYTPRFLSSAVICESLYDSKTKGICLFSGDFRYLHENIRTHLVEAPEDIEFNNENVFIGIGDEDVDKYWSKTSYLACPLLHIRVEETYMQLCRCKNWDGLSDYILYSERKISENKILTEAAPGITILTGEPGIGKTSLLQSIFKNDAMEKYILFYNLVDYGRFLEKEKLIPSNISFDFLLNEFKNKRYRQFLYALFKRKDKVLVLLDSFDEVLPIHKENVLHFIRKLVESNLQIIIASRIIANHILLTNFETRILKISNLGVDDHKEYLRNWKLSEKVPATIPDEFLQNPLHLNLLKIIFENNFNVESFSKLSLFQNVLKIKMKQYFQRNFSNQLIFNKEYYLTPVRELHFQLALMKILGMDITKQLFQGQIKYEMTNELKLGIVVSVDGRGNPTFVHETFAEYLIGDWLIRNKTKDSAKKIYLKIKEQKKLYILDIFCEHLKLHKAVLSRNIEQISLYARDRLHLEETDDLGRMAIHIAAAYQEWFEISIIICNMSQLKVNFTNSDTLMQWNWVEHSYHKRVLEGLLWIALSRIEWEAYLNTVTQTLRRDKELGILFTDFELTEIYKRAVMHNSTNMIRDLFFIADSEYSEVGTFYLRNHIKLTDLHVACIYGSVEVVRKLIKCMHINAIDQFGCTPLHYSVMNPFELSMNITNILLDNGSKTDIENNRGKTAINIAVDREDVNTLELLLKKFPLDQNSVSRELIRASSKCNRDIVGLLLEKGADVNTTTIHDETPLMVALKGGNLDVAKMLVEKGANINYIAADGITPLIFASENDNLDFTKILLEKGASVNDITSYGKAPLMCAVEQNNLDIVKMLIENGASVNSVTETDGKTPLIHASEEGNLYMVKVLVENGASVNSIAKDGKTPLRHASEKGNIDILKVLIENGASVNSVGNDGKTPLTHASKKGNLDIVKILIENGASVNSTGNDGKTPLMQASEEDDLDIVKLLVEKGANIHSKTTYGDTALILADVEGNRDVINALLECGADKEQLSPFGYPKYRKHSVCHVVMTETVLFRRDS